MKKTALPKSAAGQAVNYTLSFWSKLTVFLKHPELELSTNLAGKRDALYSYWSLDSKEAGPKSAATFSIVESYRRLNIPSASTSLMYFLSSPTAPSCPSTNSPPTAYAARLAN